MSPIAHSPYRSLAYLISRNDFMQPEKQRYHRQIARTRSMKPTGGEFPEKDQPGSPPAFDVVTRIMSATCRGSSYIGTWPAPFTVSACAPGTASSMGAP